MIIILIFIKVNGLLVIFIFLFIFNIIIK